MKIGGYLTKYGIKNEVRFLPKKRQTVSREFRFKFWEAKDIRLSKLGCQNRALYLIYKRGQNEPPPSPLTPVSTNSDKARFGQDSRLTVCPFTLLHFPPIFCPLHGKLAKTRIPQRVGTATLYSNESRDDELSIEYRVVGVN